MVIHLIEHNNTDVPRKVSKWYNTVRTFDINVVCDDILSEIINHMHLKDLESFCKTNKKYHNVKLLSKQILQEHGIYLLEEPTTYSNWVAMYHRCKIAAYKTDRVISVLNHEKNIGGKYDPWLFLATGNKNETKFNLAKYEGYTRKTITKYNHLDYDFFNLILNIDKNHLHYKYLKDNIKLKSIALCVDIYDTLYRRFYFYSDVYYLWDTNDLGFEEGELVDALLQLDGELHKKALHRLEYIRNY
jgi:hypothetical protein